MKKINIGVLGVSNHFIKRIILPLQNSTNCVLYSVASRDINKAKLVAQQFNIPKVAESYDALIKNPEVDAIFIPLPNHLHKEWTLKAIEAKKPVLCEKPIALNSDEATIIATAAEKSKIPVMEAFMYRFHPLWKYVKNLIETNQIGNINYVHSAFSYNNPSVSNIRNIKEFGGGGLLDIGCYAISVPRFILGKEPIRVNSLITMHEEFKTDMHTSALLDFGDSRASFHVSTLSEPFQKVDIVGDAGSISIPLPFNTYVDVPSSIIVNGGLGSRDVSFPICDPYGLMFEAFADALINGNDMPLPLSDAINNMKVIDAIVKSSNNNSWVNI